MGDHISHKGIVTSSGGGVVRVEIVSQSACASCHAAGLCSASEKKKKEIEVRSSFPYEVGEEVNVLLSRSMGLRAVLLAYAIPLFVILAVTVGLCYAGVPELTAGLAGLGALALWYCVVYLLRNRIAGGYAFSVEKITK